MGNASPSVVERRIIAAEVAIGFRMGGVARIFLASIPKRPLDAASPPLRLRFMRAARESGILMRVKSATPAV